MEGVRARGKRPATPRGLCGGSIPRIGCDMHHTDGMHTSTRDPCSAVDRGGEDPLSRLCRCSGISGGGRTGAMGTPAGEVALPWAYGLVQAGIVSTPLTVETRSPIPGSARRQPVGRPPRFGLAASGGQARETWPGASPPSGCSPQAAATRRRQECFAGLVEPEIAPSQRLSGVRAHQVLL